MTVRYRVLFFITCIVCASAGADSVMAEWLVNGRVISAAADSQQEPVIVADGTGGAIIAWCDSRSSDLDVYVQRVNAYGDVLWMQDGAVVCSASGDQLQVGAVSDGAHGAVVVWRDGRNADWDIYAQRVNAAGEMLWETDGVALCSEAGNQDGPRIISGLAGGAIVAWSDDRNGNYDVYAQGVTAGGNVHWRPDGLMICTDEAGQWEPVLTADGFGGAIIAWTDGRGTDPDIYAQKVCGGCDSALWAKDGIPVCTATGSGAGQLHPQVVSDGAGGAVVTWEDHRSGAPLIYAQEIDAGGNALWTANGIRVNTADSRQSGHRSITDDHGGTIVAWLDLLRSGTDSLDYDIYAQRLDGTGFMRWASDGVPVCSTTDRQDALQLAPDGSGGAFVAWGDTNSSSGSWDLLARKVDSLGTCLWDTNGERVCTVTGWDSRSRIHGRIAGVCPGDAIFAWHDDRGDDGDVYAVKLLSDGSIPVTGVPSVETWFFLSQNFPNPFNPATTIAFGLGKPANVTVRIYDASGRLVRVLVEQRFGAGTYTRTWDGTDDLGSEVASGVYFCRLTAGGFAQTKKIVLIR